MLQISPAEAVADRDAIAYLRERGFGSLLDALGDPEVYSVPGRLILRRLARRMGTSIAAAASDLDAARGILAGAA